jgi:NADPH:quinone reductase-like Zn-dependent oxidoreductase
VKALIKTVPGDGGLTWDDRPEPSPGPGEVTLELVASPSLSPLPRTLSTSRA